jgi:hypothetical protein
MSQATLETTQFDGHTYGMYQLPPMVSHDLLMDFTRMVGPAVGPLLDTLFAAFSGKGVEAVLEMDLTPSFFTAAAGSLFGGIDKRVIENTIRKFSEYSEVDGMKMTPGIFEAHFLGNLDAMYRWLAWGMKVQWGKSLRALAEGLKNRGAQMIPPAPASPRG